MTSIVPTATIISTSNNPPTPAPPITATLTLSSAVAQHVVGEVLSGSEPGNEVSGSEDPGSEEVGNEETGNEEPEYEVREKLVVVTLSEYILTYMLCISLLESSISHWNLPIGSKVLLFRCRRTTPRPLLSAM